jgi:hypothetical protein
MIDLAKWKYLTTTRAECLRCGQAMDVRGARVKFHERNSHGDGALPEVPPPVVAEEPPVEEPEVVVEPEPPIPEEAPKPAHEVGSRKWAIKEIHGIINGANATPEQKLKGLDLLKEYEAYGSDRLDDEREVEESKKQWDRVFSKMRGIREVEEYVLKDKSARRRLESLLQATAEA